MVNHILEKFTLDQKVRYSMLEGEALNVAIESQNNIDQLELKLKNIDNELENCLDDHYDMECELNGTQELFNNIVNGIQHILNDKKMKKVDILTELKDLLNY